MSQLILQVYIKYAGQCDRFRLSWVLFFFFPHQVFVSVSTHRQHVPYALFYKISAGICSFPVQKDIILWVWPLSLFSLSRLTVSGTYCRKVGQYDSTGLDFFLPLSFISVSTHLSQKILSLIQTPFWGKKSEYLGHSICLWMWTPDLSTQH